MYKDDEILAELRKTKEKVAQESNFSSRELFEKLNTKYPKSSIKKKAGKKRLSNDSVSE